MIFAVCLVVALANLAAGQRWDPLACGSGFRESVTKYSENLQASIREFSTKVSQQGSSALDIQGFSKDANQLLSQVASLGDTSQALDAQRVLKINWEIIQSQLKLSRYFFNPSIGMSMFREYVSFSRSVVSLNTEFIDQVAAQCVPSNGSARLAAPTSSQ